MLRERKGTHLIVTLLLAQLVFSGCSSQEERGWERARRADTVEAYEAFLKEFPSGNFSAPAQTQLRKLREPEEWRKAESAGTIESYRAFLQAYPDGENSAQAESRLTEVERQMRVAQVRLSPTIESMSSYLKDYPSSPEINEIRVKLRPLLLAEALSRKTSTQYKEFLACFPEDSEASKIRSLLRPLLREEAHRERTAVAYHEFLSYFPEDPEAAQFLLRAEIASLASQDRWPVGSLRTLRSRTTEAPLPPNLLGLFALSSDRSRLGFPSVSSKVLLGEQKIIAALRSGGPVSLEVCYFTKANQLYLSEFVSVLLSRALLHPYLEGRSTALEERSLEPVTPDQIIERQSEIDEFNSMLEEFNGREYERETALRLFNERLQIFSGLLPLQELSIYSSVEDRLRAVEVEPRGVTVPIFPLSAAVQLIRSGDVEEGFVLLDAIGKIKLAYLGVLLAGNLDDYSQSGKIQVLETDLRRYYDFVEREIIPMAPAGSGRFPETLIAYAGEAQDLHALNSFREELEQAKSRGARRSWR
jgi:hypothetical protein